MSVDERSRAARTGEADVAIIGMAFRFPGADTRERFWSNLRDGVESIGVISDDELRGAGVPPALSARRDYVRARGRLDGVDRFDAGFFGYSPREAELLDPQQRLFLECAWEALDDAAYAPGTHRARVGVYAGSALSSYLIFRLAQQPGLLDAAGHFHVLTSNDKDFLSTRVSYKLDLRGPSITVQTACSTSLVAVHLACQGLLSGECDLALAGAVSILVPQEQGYLYTAGGIHSHDGHCRAFDAAADGTVFSSGVGIVVLKRLEDAIADGDCIAAVVKGTAVNNDGALKIGFTAPSIAGQAEVIAEALGVADVDPRTIGYIEAHGTATPLGDPIEVAALNRVFGASAPASCALGSVKTNIGHLDTVAGIAGLLKVVLALENEVIPPSLHFHAPNAEIDFKSSPFYVNASSRAWKRGAVPRRAGISSFGIGGTNAHVVVEEAPEPAAAGSRRPWQLLLVSAKTAPALESATGHLIEHLRRHPEQDLADVAYTLQVGRRPFDHRRVVVCANHEDAARALEARDPERVFTNHGRGASTPVVFMFPGQGPQYVGMGRELYGEEPVFGTSIDRCAELLTGHLGLDLREVLYPDADSDEDAAQARLDETRIAHVAIFAVEYALAQLWLSWGVRPDAMIGYSLGEYAAACIAGVLSLEDALLLVAARARLMHALPGGAMLSVPLPQNEIAAQLRAGLSLAAVNGPAFTVVSGESVEIARLEAELLGRQVDARRLHVTHAFHSAMMDPVVEPYTARVARVALNPPAIPIASSRTGTWLAPEEAMDPLHWGRHLREPVRFSQAMNAVLQDEHRVLLEVGPGSTLGALSRRLEEPSRARVILASLRHGRDRQPDLPILYATLGKLWLSGAQVDWQAFHARAPRCRVRVPTYPFQRQRYWVEAAGGQGYAGAAEHPRMTDSAEAAPATDAGTSAGHTLYARPQLFTAHVAPATAIEHTIAALWEEVLGIAGPGIHDDFFELGGHSLLATRLAARLRESFPVDLPLRGVFEAPTIARMAALIEDALLQAVEALSDEDAERLLLSAAPEAPAAAR